MRDLTEGELELAPGWATHYFIDTDDDVIYESEGLCWWLDLDNPMDNYTFDADKNKPINRRSFDISPYEFVDLEIGQAEVNGDGLQINMVDGSRPPIIYKRDIAVMAKALGMSEKDFK